MSFLYENIVDSMYSELSEQGGVTALTAECPDAGSDGSSTIMKYIVTTFGYLFHRDEIGQVPDVLQVPALPAVRDTVHTLLTNMGTGTYMSLDDSLGLLPDDVELPAEVLFRLSQALGPVVQRGQYTAHQQLLGHRLLRVATYDTICAFTPTPVSVDHPESVLPDYVRFFLQYVHELRAYLQGLESSHEALHPNILYSVKYLLSRQATFRRMLIGALLEQRRGQDPNFDWIETAIANFCLAVPAEGFQQEDLTVLFRELVKAQVNLMTCTTYTGCPASRWLDHAGMNGLRHFSPEAVLGVLGLASYKLPSVIQHIFLNHMSCVELYTRYNQCLALVPVITLLGNYHLLKNFQEIRKDRLASEAIRGAISSIERPGNQILPTKTDWLDCLGISFDHGGRILTQGNSLAVRTRVADLRGELQLPEELRSALPESTLVVGIEDVNEFRLVTFLGLEAGFPVVLIPAHRDTLDFLLGAYGAEPNDYLQFYGPFVQLMMNLNSIGAREHISKGMVLHGTAFGTLGFACCSVVNLEEFLTGSLRSASVEDMFIKLHIEPSPKFNQLLMEGGFSNAQRSQ